MRNWTPVIDSLLNRLIRHDIVLEAIYDGEHSERLTATGAAELKAEALDAITAVDVSRLYVSFQKEKGWLLIILDEDPDDVVADWCPAGDSYLSALLTTAVDEHTDEWRGKPCPREEERNGGEPH